MKSSSLRELSSIREPQEFLLTEQQGSALNDMLPPRFSLIISPRVKRKAVTQLCLDTVPILSAQNIEEKTLKLPHHLRVCFKILNKLKVHPRALAFLVPVDPELMGIPDYFAVITEPMDLSKIEKKLLNLEYNSPEEFEKDVYLIYQNAKTYNDPTHFVHIMAIEMEAFTTQLFRINRFLKKVKTQQKLAIFTKIDKEFDKSSSTARLLSGEFSECAKKKQLIHLITEELPKKYIWEICRILALQDSDENELSIDFSQISDEKLCLIANFIDMHTSIDSKQVEVETENIEEQIKEEVPASTPPRKESISAYWNSPEQEASEK